MKNRKKRAPRKPYKQKSRHQHRGPSDKELYMRLTFTLIGIILTVTLLIISFTNFGPKIGSLFGLFSKYRNIGAPRDEFPPPPPRFSSTPQATTNENLILNGFGEPGSTIKLYMNGPEVASTVTDNDGLFTFANLKLREGQNVIFAKAYDQEKNESEKSITLTIELDTEKPEVTILEPINGATIKNLDKRILVKGEISEKAIVTINGSVAIVKPDLTYEKLIGANEGSMEIKVIATDNAGNEVEEVIFIEYKEES